MKKSIFKPADFVLLAVLIIIGIAGSFLVASGQNSGSTVVIKTDGKLYGTYPLSGDQTIVVETGLGSNTVEISGGTVSVTEADCHNQVCVDHAPISLSGESIICLPNKLIVTIEGDAKGDGLDAVSN